jgi:uncharacterized DUF497 family protein
MNRITFSWDKNKAAQNARKHGVSFEEAMSIFLDENAIEFYDPDHSESEDRFVMLGISFRLRLLVVCYAVREGGTRLRLISARKARKNEAKRYTREVL